MIKDCNTCIHKEGSCYPSTTIFDKDKTCKSYDPDYEGYIADLEKENAELDMKRKAERQIFQGIVEKKNEQLTKAKELLEDLVRFQPYIDREAIFHSIGNEWKTAIYKAEQFLKEIEK